MNSLVNAEILTETSERECSNGKCLYSTYEGKMFHYENNRYYYFNEYVTLTPSSYNLIYQTPTSRVNLTTYVTYAGTDRDISTLSSSVRNQLDYQTQLTRLKNEYKFNVTFSRTATTNSLSRIGYRFNTASRITPTDRNSVIIGNIEYSYQDLIDNKFIVDYDTRTNTLWITTTSLNGFVRLDPLSSFYSLSNDGYLAYAETDLSTCIGNQSTSTTIDLGHPAISPLNRNHGMLEFNTSTIASNQTLNQSTVEVYVGAYGSNCNVNTEEIEYWTKGGNFGSLTCSDDIQSSGVYIGTVNFNKATGWKVKTVPVVYVNRTSSTLFELVSGWLRLSCVDGQSNYYRTRMSEFTGTTTDPIMKVWTYDVALNLSNPSNNQNISINTTGNITDFKFNLTSMFTINNCSLIINNSINKTVTSGINKTLGTNTISYTLNNTGKYIWYINCSYNSTYIAKSSESWYFNVTNISSIPPSPSTIPEITVYPNSTVTPPYPLINFNPTNKIIVIVINEKTDLKFNSNDSLYPIIQYKNGVEQI